MWNRGELQRELSVTTRVGALGGGASRGEAAGQRSGWAPHTSRVRFRMRTGAGARAAAARDAIMGMVWYRLAKYHLEAAKAAMQELGAEVAAGAMHGQHATLTRSWNLLVRQSDYWCETSASRLFLRTAFYFTPSSIAVLTSNIVTTCHHIKYNVGDSRGLTVDFDF